MRDENADPFYCHNMLRNSLSALAVQLIENCSFGEVVSDSGEVSTTSSGSSERVT